MCARSAEQPPAQDAARFLDAFIATTSVVLRICRHTGGKSGLFCLLGAFGAGPLCPIPFSNGARSGYSVLSGWCLSGAFVLCVLMLGTLWGKLGARVARLKPQSAGVGHQLRRPFTGRREMADHPRPKHLPWRRDPSCTKTETGPHDRGRPLTSRAS